MDIIYDFTIIGGGPAGSSAASFLAREGYKVLVLEKALFPRDHVGESLIPFCYNVFEDLGVLDKMKAKFSRKPGVTFSNIEGSQSSNWCFHKVIDGPEHLSFHVRRAFFDEMLLNHSEELGATVMQETKVTKVDFESDKDLVLVSAVSKQKGSLEIKSKHLIDASGLETFLGKKFKTKKPIDSMRRRIAFSSHWVDLDYTPELAEGNLQIVQLEGEKQGWVWLVPIDDNRASIGVVIDLEYSKQQKKNLSGNHENWQREFYLQELMTSPTIKNILKNAKTALPIAVNSDFSFSVENKYGDRYSIIGDASAFLDPIFSSGIYLGIRSAQLVSKALIAKVEHNDEKTLQTAYKDIAGAYRLVEKLINTFYEPNSIRFSDAKNVLDDSYEKFESAYSILHLVLAGDFFTNYEKYIKAIDLLSDDKMIAKYKNLIKRDNSQNKGELCLEKTK